MLHLPAKDLVAEILKANSGEHAILVYPHHESFREIYPQLAKKILKDNGIVVLLTYYEPISRVFQNLSDEGIDVDEERKRGTLIVGDAVDEFFTRGKDFLSFLLNVERRLKQMGKSHVSVIVSMSAFFLYEKEEDEMVEYEGLLDLSEVRNWKVLCCYHKDDFDRLSEQTKQVRTSCHSRRLFAT